MKVEGSNITITDSVYNKMSIIPKGACEQDGTPTPDNHIPVKVVTGDNSVVVQNKNWFDKTSNIVLNKYIGGDGTIQNEALNWYQEDYISVNSSTDYIMSSNTSTTVRIALYDKDKNFITRSYSIGSVQVTTTASTKYVRISGYNNINDNIQLEKGSTATSYVPHAEQTYTLHLGTNYLAGIGDYKDEIVGKTDEWKIVRKVGKVVLSGSVGETYSLSTIYTDTVRISYTNAISNYVQSTILSNYFTYEATNNDIPHIRFNNTGNIFFYINKTDATDANSFISWLSTHNTIVYYPLATPTEETITDTTLIADLNNMYQAMGYDGKTNITVTSEDTNAQMEVEVTYTSESDMCEKLLFIFNKMKDKLYHIIRSL